MNNIINNMCFLIKYKHLRVLASPHWLFLFQKIQDFNKIQAFEPVGVPAGAFSFSKKQVFVFFDIFNYLFMNFQQIISESF